VSGLSRALASLAGLLVAGCTVPAEAPDATRADAGDPGEVVEAVAPGDDAAQGPEASDAGDPTDDAGNPTDDVGDPTSDAGDAGDPTDDAGDPTDDAGSEVPDGDEPDAATPGDAAEVPGEAEVIANSDTENTAQNDTILDTIAESEVTSDTSDEPAATGPCARPLTFAEPERYLEPLQFAVLAVTGGSGRHAFAVRAGAESGARVHPLLGTFMAGPSPGEVVVRAVDHTCGAFADLEIHVTAPLAVTPPVATISPVHGRIRHAVSGGSGRWRVRLAALSAGAPVAARVEEDGTIVAGDVAESLIVAVEDLATGRLREARLTVVEGGGLQVDASAIAIPVGERWPMSGLGGSGVLEVTAPDPAPGTEAVIAVDGVTVKGLAPGRVDVVVEDVHTGERVHVPVEVAATPEVALYPAGDLKESGAAVTADLDADGYPELVVGVTESDLGAWDGGAVIVYPGTARGPGTQPRAVRVGAGRGDELGNAIAAGDVDGDGYGDVVAGAPLADGPGLDRGSLVLWRGRPGGGLSATPDWTWFGENNSDQVGMAVGLCDVNGDGRLDLLATARFAEDEDRTPTVSSSGGLFVFLGYAAGFRSEPDQVIWGAVPVDGVMQPRAVNLGRALATGNVDGDGRCDVAVSGTAFSAGEGRSSDGVVHVYRGRGPDSFGPGGLALAPSLTVRGDDVESGAQLGFSLALGDLDGDGRDDLAMGQPELAITPQGGTRRASNGAALLVAGASIPDQGLLDVSVRSIGWRYVGRAEDNETSDRFGISVAIGDWDGQGTADLFIGTRADEQLVPPATTRVADTGTVHVLRGATGQLPALGPPDAVYAGDATSQQFGPIFAVHPDLDGDGRAELVGRATQDSRLGPRVGLTWLRMSTPETPVVALATPLGSGGSRLGASLAVVGDLDGDGFPELAVGAPRAQHEPGPLPVPQTRPGLVSLHRTGPLGVSQTPFATLAGFPGHSQLDGFGEALAAVRDFNGDGRPDLAVAARQEDGPTGCARTDPGAVYLFGGTPAGGLAPSPMGFFLGPLGSAQTNELASGDFNGDGLSDIALAGQLWDLPDTTSSNNAGGVGLVYGTSRMAAAGPLVTRCQPDVTLLGFNAADQLGAALAAVPDLNGDGCDELAVGAPFGDLPGLSNSGFVHLLWGFGPRCAFRTAHRATLSPRHASAQIGASLAAGDVDGDGRADLVVGGPAWSDGVDTTGAAWLIDGGWLASLAGSATPWTEAVAVVSGEVAPLVPPGAMTRRLDGRQRDEALGSAVALIPAASGELPGGILASAPVSAQPGAPGAGTVRFHTLAGLGGLAALTPASALAIAGESSRPGAEFGAALTAWRAGGRRWVAVGAPASSALGTDEGAFFVVSAP
jgi:hypothetical protein